MCPSVWLSTKPMNSLITFLITCIYLYFSWVSSLACKLCCGAGDKYNYDDSKRCGMAGASTKALRQPSNSSQLEQRDEYKSQVTQFVTVICVHLS
jgi:hypothetical protein